MSIRQVDLNELGNEEDKGKDKPDSKTASARKERERAQSDKSLSDRLEACFDRIAEALEQRGDAELADLVREDARVMAGGLLNLTRPFQPIRVIVVAFVSIIEPALAFGRILRVLVERWAANRTRATTEEPQDDAAFPPPVT